MSEIILFHGSKNKFHSLIKGTYVTKYPKDAQKFGHRHSVQTNSPKVYVHIIKVESWNIARDKTRDGSFILLKNTKVTLIKTYNTYDISK